MSSEPTTPPTEMPPTADAPADETARLTAELAARQDNLLRLAADFDNFKKRAARERDEARRNGVESVIGRLLPVLDNFDMAMAAASQPNTTLDSLRTGVAMIHGQLRTLLGDVGVTPLEAVGQPFDPSVHEAVSTCPTREHPEGHVTQQVRRGYRFGDRLIRPASVVVATAATE